MRVVVLDENFNKYNAEIDFSLYLKLIILLRHLSNLNELNCTDNPSNGETSFVKAKIHYIGYWFMRGVIKQYFVWCGCLAQVRLFSFNCDYNFLLSKHSQYTNIRLMNYFLLHYSLTSVIKIEVVEN